MEKCKVPTIYGFHSCITCSKCDYLDCACLSDDDKKRVYHMHEYMSGLDGDRD